MNLYKVLVEFETADKERYIIDVYVVATNIAKAEELAFEKVEHSSFVSSIEFLASTDFSVSERMLVIE